MALAATGVDEADLVVAVAVVEVAAVLLGVAEDSVEDAVVAVDEAEEAAVGSAVDAEVVVVVAVVVDGSRMGRDEYSILRKIKICIFTNRKLKIHLFGFFFVIQ